MKNKNLTNLFCLLLTAIMMLSFASCGASSNKMEMDNSYPSYSDSEMSKEDVSIDLNSGSINNTPQGDSNYERKIIRTANISAETKEFDSAIDLIEKACYDLGGYIERSSVRGQSLDSSYSHRHADFTLRIPVESFDSFNDQLGSILNIVSSQSNADEVTSHYYDIKSRIEVLEMQKESLQQLYKEYTNMGDVNYLLEIQDKLFAVIEEIEAYETQIRLYDDKIAYSTVHLNVSEVIVYTESRQEETFGEKISNAFLGGWSVFVNICEGLAIAFVATLPTLTALGILAFVIVFICVTSSRKRRAKKAMQNKSEE
jgi:hypothetical protein